MESDSFQCKKCGEILQSGMIAAYRTTKKSGGSISGGGIRCGHCGTVYSVEDITKTDQQQKVVLIIILIVIAVIVCFWLTK